MKLSIAAVTRRLHAGWDKPRLSTAKARATNPAISPSFLG
jgi:hypothetical protein